MTHQLTDTVTCDRCGVAESVFQHALNDKRFAISDDGLAQDKLPYTCAACKRAKRREAQETGRRERQAAQRRVHIRELRGSSRASPAAPTLASPVGWALFMRALAQAVRKRLGAHRRRAWRAPAPSEWMRRLR